MHKRLFVLSVALAACESSVLTLPLPPVQVVPGEVGGRVVAASAAVAGAEITLPFAGLTTRSDADGRFVFTGVPEGNQRLEVASERAGARLFARRDAIAVFGGQRTDVGEIVLDATGTLRGRVKTGSPAGNAGAIIYIGMTSAATVSTDDGRYVLAGVPVGVVTVEAHLTGHQVGRTTVTVAAGATVDDVDIALVPRDVPLRGTVSGVVKTQRAEHTRGTVVVVEGTGLAATSDDEGSYRLDGVPEGVTQLVFVHDGYITLRVAGIAIDGTRPFNVPTVVLRPVDPNDLDGDGTGDAADPDVDGDGTPNAEDAFPRDVNERADHDLDGVGDRADGDDDDDGLADLEETAEGLDGFVTDPLDPDTDDDTFGDLADLFPTNPAEWADTDRDGDGDNGDNCRFSPNPLQEDSDGDGLGDACDLALNHPPLLVIEGETSVDEGAEIVLTARATDEDGQAVSIVARSLPANAAFEVIGGGVAKIHFRPSFAQAGTVSFTVAATDGIAVVEKQHQVLVADVPAGDVPPSLRVLGRRAVFEGELVDLSVIAEDPEGAPITIEIVEGLPEGADFASRGPGTSVLTWVTSYDDAGTHRITFRATANGTSVDVEEALVVANVNRPPSLEVPLRKAAVVGEEVTLGATASDPDGDTVAITIVGALPTGATFTDAGNGTALFRWTPNAAAAASGGVDLTFRAGDAELATSRSVRIDVYPAPNKPPTLSIAAVLQVNEGATLDVVVTSADPDGDAVLLAARQVPANATFSDNGNGTGRFVFKPDFAQAGSFSVDFVATDGRAATVERRLIAVHDVPGNTPPTLNVGGATRVQETGAFELTALAADPDPGAKITLSATGMPAGATFVDRGDGTGTFRWVTGYADAGSRTVTFRASDGQVTVDHPVLLEVDDKNRPPVLAAVTTPRTVSAGTVLNLTLVATDPDPGNALVLSVSPSTRAGLVFNDQGTGQAAFAFTPQIADRGTTVSFTFAVSDGAVSATQPLSVTVPAAGNQPPVWAIVPPQTINEGQTLQLDLTATDADGTLPQLRTTALVPGAAFTDGGNGTGHLTYAPAYTIASNGGTTNVVVKFVADDGTALTNLDLTIAVKDVNRAPLVDPQLDAVLGSGASRQFVTSATDPDGATGLVYSYAILPPLAFTQGTGVDTNKITLAPTVTETGTYTVTVKVKDPAGAEGTDDFAVTVVAGHFEAMPTPPPAPWPPSPTHGELLQDVANARFLYLDHKRYPDKIWIMALGENAFTQTWTVSNTTNAPSATENYSAIVHDTVNDALFLFRSGTSDVDTNTDVWRLNLGSLAWTQVATVNPRTLGCFAEQGRVGWYFDPSAKRIYCPRLGNGTGAQSGSSFATTPGQYAFTAYPLTGTATASTTFIVFTNGPGNKAYTVFMPAYAAMRVHEITYGASAATSAELVATNTSVLPVPDSELYANVVYDHPRRRLIVAGGRQRIGSGGTREVWEFNVDTRFWTKLNLNNPGPPIRFYPELQLVESQRKLYFGFGCDSDPNGAAACVSLLRNDLWIGDVGTNGF